MGTSVVFFVSKENPMYCDSVYYSGRVFVVCDVDVPLHPESLQVSFPLVFSFFTPTYSESSVVI